MRVRFELRRFNLFFFFFVIVLSVSRLPAFHTISFWDVHCVRYLFGSSQFFGSLAGGSANAAPRRRGVLALRNCDPNLPTDSRF